MRSSRATGKSDMRALEEGYACSKDAAAFIAWGVENVDPMSPVADMCYPLDVVYPLRDIGFEGAVFKAPNDGEEVCRLIYGDWLELPNDMFSRFRHVELDARIVQMLEEFVEGGAA